MQREISRPISHSNNWKNVLLVKVTHKRMHVEPHTTVKRDRNRAYTFVGVQYNVAPMYTSNAHLHLYLVIVLMSWYNSYSVMIILGNYALQHTSWCRVHISKFPQAFHFDKKFATGLTTYKAIGRTGKKW